MNDTDADRLEIAFRDAYRANDDVQFDSAVESLRTFVKRLRQRLLSAAGDDLCRLTQDEIKALSDGSVKIPPKEEFLASCERFHAQIAKESGVMENCLTLAQLIAENELLTQQLAATQTKVERLRLLVESAFQDGWMHGAACGNPNGGYATYDWEQSDSRRELNET